MDLPATRIRKDVVAMARRPIPVRMIMEHLNRGESARFIARTKGVSQGSVKLVREAAKEKGLTWEDVRDMSDPDAYALLLPDRAKEDGAVADVDYDYMHAELMRDGVTLKLLWEEYRDKATAEGEVPVSYQTLCRNYAKYVGARNVTSHIDHKPGQVMEVDWSGTKMQLVDAFSGEVTKASLFVATLPYSQYSYVEATPDQKMRSWIMCHVHAWDFFGGVAVRTVPDNLKTGVTKHPKEGEIVLNAQYEALGCHYQTAIMPTGVRKPTHKPSVESAVGDVATDVVARLRNRTFHTLDQLNAAIREKLDEYNARPFQKREGSRKEVFEDVGQPFLGPLPDSPYNYCEWVYGRKVQKNCHVQFDKNYYSAPSALVGRCVDIRYGDNVVEIFHAGERVASHVRFGPNVHYQYRTEKSHMPEGSQRPEWDDARIKGWASSVGPNTLGVVTRIFDSVAIKEQAYNPTLAILGLTKHYTNRQLEDACAYALARNPAPRYQYLRSVIASGVAEGCSDAQERQELDERKREGTRLRGADYYGKGARPC